MRAIALAAVLLVQGTASTRLASGTVMGEIRSVDGGPAAGVRVSALAVSDEKAVTLVSLAQTDNAGRYKLEDIPAGRYYISAGLLDFPTYYPGVKRPEEARVVTVGVDASLSGINFTLVRPAGVRVSGTVSGIPTGAPPGMFNVSLLQPGGSASSGPLTLPVQPDGAFEFPKVSPGTFTVRVTPSVATDFGLSSNLRIQVDDKDIRDIAWTIPPTLLGRVVVEDGSKLPVQAAAGAGGTPDAPALVLLRIRVGNTTNLTVVVRADGFFLFPAPAGEYPAVGLTQLPFGYYIKSISYAGVDLAGGSSTTSGEAALPDLHVTLTTTPPASAPAGVTVSGRVTGFPANDASPRWVSMQLSIPAAKWPETRVGEATIRSDGTFEVLHVPPGRINARTIPAGAAMQIDVADRDVPGVELSPGCRLPVAITGTTITAAAAAANSREGQPPVAGARVSGRVTGAPRPGPGFYTIEPWTITLIESGGPTRLTRQLDACGALYVFDFPAVPAGTYTVQLLLGSRRMFNEAIVVRDKDLSGVEIRFAQ